jgi:hypothetical protein
VDPLAGPEQAPPPEVEGEATEVDEGALLRFLGARDRIFTLFQGSSSGLFTGRSRNVKA